MSLSQSNTHNVIPKSPIWRPVTSRSWYNFVCLIRGLLNRSEGLNIGGTIVNNTVAGPIDKYGYLPTASGHYPPPLLAIWGVPASALFAITAPQPIPMDWLQARTQFWKYITPKFTVHYEVQLLLRPIQYELRKQDFFNIKPARFLIVVQRCLYQAPANTSPALVANGIPFPTNVAALTGKVHSDDSWYQYLRQKDPRLLHWEIVTMTPPNRVGTSANQADLGVPIIGAVNKTVKLPPLTLNAWAGDPSFVTGPFTEVPGAVRDAYFANQANYPYTNTADGFTTPVQCQPCFISIIDISNKNSWFQPGTDADPHYFTACSSVSCKIEMPTTLFPKVTEVDVDFENNAAGGEVPTGPSVPTQDVDTATNWEWSGNDIVPILPP